MRKKYNWLPDFVYGSIDGIVTTFAVVSGVQGASLAINIILILGFANLIGDGFSMAVGKYMSDKAELDGLKKEGKTNENINPLLGGWYTFLSFNLLGLVPLSGYLISPLFDLTVDQKFWLTCLFTTFALFIVGLVKARFTGGNKLVSGIQVVFIGGIAAVLSYYIGFFVHSLLS